MTDPMLTFFAAFLIALMFFWYFATDIPMRKRWIGTFLTIAISLFCLFNIFTPRDFFAALGLAEKPADAEVADDQPDPSIWKKLAAAQNLKAGIDIQGGSAFTLRISPPEDRDLTDASINQAISVIRNRLDPDGTSDLEIVRRGSDQIIVSMPGISEEERETVRTQLEQAAHLTFHRVHPESQRLAREVADGDRIEPGYTAKEYYRRDRHGNIEGPAQEILIETRPVMDGSSVSRARETNDPNQGWVTNITFDSAGARTFAALTRENVGRQIAILLDGEVVSAPNVNEPILGGSAVITGMGSERAARDLSNVLNNPLESPMEIEEEMSVSPTLGAATVRQGILAGVFGLSLTLIFLAVWYRVAGLIALAGLSVCMLFLFGMMSIFQFTFTLPGIAGIILTIGMAVDANVLIFERLKEEQSSGKSLAAAIETAYNKAFSAIFDANVTTLITACILFWLATDAVKGFAVTLTLGIISSLFAALIVTRIIFQWLLDAKALKKLGIGRAPRNRGIDFLGRRRTAFVFSMLLIVVCLGTLGTKREAALGVDFVGGDMVTFQFPEGTEITADAVEESLNDLELPITPRVQKQRNPADNLIYIMIRTGEHTSRTLTDEDGNIIQLGVIDHLREDMALLAERNEATGDFLYEASTSSISGTFSRELFFSSGLALFFGMVGIVIYISIRFEFSFALGAAAAVFHDLFITIGILVLLGYELNAPLIGAVLTIAGYSINDTIVIFDRIRENIALKRGSIKDIMNQSLNSTLSRTILTSGTTLLTLATLFIFGGPNLRDFSATLIIGVCIGTYSSIFVAAPIVLWWSRKTGKSLRREVLDARDAQQAPALGQTSA